MSVQARYIKQEELQELLALYRQLHADDPELACDQALTSLWEAVLNDPSQHYLVVEEEGRLVASCVLVIVQNLTRGARPYGLIENVVTHSEYRKRGYGSAVLQKALAIAREKNCYKVMLLTSSKEESTFRFYEKAGFIRGKKTGFIVNFD